jgi:hypothetical protein
MEMFIGFMKFRIRINRRLLEEQETFHVPGCGRLTALSAANIQIAVGLLNNEECSTVCLTSVVRRNVDEIYTLLGCYAALSGR